MIYVVSLLVEPVNPKSPYLSGQSLYETDTAKSVEEAVVEATLSVVKEGFKVTQVVHATEAPDWDDENGELINTIYVTMKKDQVETVTLQALESLKEK